MKQRRCWFRLTSTFGPHITSSKQNRLKGAIFDIGNGIRRSLPILINFEFDIDFNFDGIHNVVENLTNLNYKLTANLALGKTSTQVHGLLDTDSIQYIGPLQIIKCIHGSEWRITSGIIPFGNITDLLYPNQRLVKY